MSVVKPQNMVNHRVTANKEVLCVFGDQRGVFGIPHSAAKLNNQFLDD